MTTLATSALNIAKQLGRVDAAGTTIVDLGDEIKEEIRNTIRHFNRRPWHLTETRLIEFDTVAGQVWYNEGLISTGAATTEALTVLASNVIVVDTAASTSVDFIDLVHIDYIRETSSSLDDGLREFKYRDFERLFEGSALGGVPYAFTRYGGQIGIYPTPQAAHTIQMSATIKGAVPAADTGTSVWFTRANELIEASAAGRVCVKHLRDNERANAFAAIAAPLERELHQEYVRNSATGRIKPHD